MPSAKELFLFFPRCLDDLLPNLKAFSPDFPTKNWDLSWIGSWVVNRLVTLGPSSFRRKNQGLLAGNVVGWQDNAFCPSKLYPCLLQRLKVWIGGLRHNANVSVSYKFRLVRKPAITAGASPWNRGPRLVRNHAELQTDQVGKAKWIWLDETSPKLPFVERHFELLCVRICEDHGACSWKLEWSGDHTWNWFLEVRYLNNYLPTDVSISSFTCDKNHGRMAKKSPILTQKYLQTDTMVHRLGPFLYETNLLSRKDQWGEFLDPRMVLDERKLVSECPRYASLVNGMLSFATIFMYLLCICCWHIGILILYLPFPFANICNHAWWEKKYWSRTQSGTLNMFEVIWNDKHQ